MDLLCPITDPMEMVVAVNLEEAIIKAAKGAALLASLEFAELVVTKVQAIANPEQRDMCSAFAEQVAINLLFTPFLYFDFQIKLTV